MQELAKRQHMQYMMIKKDQIISDLQQQLQESWSSRTITSPALPELPVPAEADSAGSAHMKAMPNSQSNGSGFGSPVPLSWRPPLTSGPQFSRIQSCDSFLGVSPRPVGKVQRPSGASRRGMYVQPQQQRQHQGSSIMDGCSGSVRAATFCCSPHGEVRCNIGPARVFTGSMVLPPGGGVVSNHWGDRQVAFNNSQKVSGTLSVADRPDCSIMHRGAHTFA